MLQKIRGNLQGIIAKVIIVLITIPFVLWGVDALFLDSGNPDVAEVNGKAITELELNQQVYRQRQQMLQRMGDQVDPSQVDEAMLRGPVLEQLIQQRLLESTAESRGLVVSDQVVDSVILADPEFQEDGVFSPERFDVLVRSNGMTPALYKQAMRRQILINQLMSGMVATEFVTDADLALAASISGQQRDVEYAVMTVEQAMSAVNLDEAEVRSYFDSHPDEFVTDETVSVEFIELRLEDFTPTVDEDELRAAYESSIAAIEVGSRRRAAHILLEVGDGAGDAAVEQQLKEIRAQAEAGEAFSELAKANSADIGSRQMGGDLGYTDGTAFPEAFEDALAALEVGEISQPVRTDAGWHLVKLTEIEEADIPAYEERRDELLASLEQEKAEPLYAVKLEELKDISFNAADLASVAEQLELTTGNSQPFSRDGAEAGLFADNRLVAEAYSSAVFEQGANSEVVEISPTHAVVLRIAERTPSAPIPFEEVEPALAERLHREKATAYMEQRAADIVTAVEGGQLLAEMADSEGLEYDAHAGMSREDIADVPMEIAVAAFQLSPPGEGASSLEVKTLSDGNVAIVAVSKVEPGQLADMDAASRSAMRRMLGQYQAERIARGYRAELQDAADIEMM